MARGGKDQQVNSKYAGRFLHDQNTVDEIRRLRMIDPEIWKVDVLAERFNMSKSQISKICNRKQRKEKIDIHAGVVHLRDDSRL